MEEGYGIQGLVRANAEWCFKSSGKGLDRTLRIYGFQEDQSKKRGRSEVSAARGGFMKIEEMK